VGTEILFLFKAMTRQDDTQPHRPDAHDNNPRNENQRNENQRDENSHDAGLGDEDVSDSDLDNSDSDDSDLDDDAALEPLTEERKKIIITVPNIKERERIDKFLARQMENATRNKIQEAIDAGRILVNGKSSKANYKLAPGDVIEVTFTHPPPPEMKPENIPLDVIYEDAVLMVINKPAGMVVHPAFGNWTGTLANAALYHTQQLSTYHEDDLRPGIVHRLDKDTSGLIVVAKDDGAHAALAKQFAERTTEKKYLALVWGVPKQMSGTIKTNIGRSKRDRKVMATFPYNESERADGKHAVTDYALLEDFTYFSLLELTLHTGRTHQIRVHLQSIGHPIFSDEAYGGKTGRALGFAKSEAFIQNLFSLLPRQALHAAFLSFVHPTTKKRVEFHAPLPADIHAAIEKIKTLPL
jgi:23S rRNA pseudouridine1911/1915/1917 synthase